MKKILILATTATLLFSCKKNDDNKSGTFTGPDVAIQQGKGKSWIKLDANGAPQQLGLSIDDAAMNSLPADGDGSEVTLPLHRVAKSATPFDHIEVGWNPSWS